MKRDNILASKQEIILCQTAALGQAFSHQHRLKLVSLLAQSSKTVEELARDIGQSVAATSAHLKVLRSAAVVAAHKQGRYVRYRISSERVATFLVALRRLAEELAPEVREIMRDYFQNPDSLSPLTEGELLSELKAGRIMLLDLRPEPEFASGRIPGAVNLPFTTLVERAKRLPRRKQYAAYCRGPYCLMAVQGTETLRSLGYNVRRLRFGTSEWRAAGYKLEHVQVTSGDSVA